MLASRAKDPSIEMMCITLSHKRLEDAWWQTTPGNLITEFAFVPVRQINAACSKSLFMGDIDGN